MNVRLRIQFEPVTEEDRQAMRSLANSLTDRRESVRVLVDQDPDWLVAELTMPTEAQYKAVPKIDSAIRFYASNRSDSSISFPRTEEERARAARKQKQRKQRN